MVGRRATGDTQYKFGELLNLDETRGVPTGIKFSAPCPFATVIR
jgi:hypothetical protein